MDKEDWKIMGRIRRKMRAKLKKDREESGDGVWLGGLTKMKKSKIKNGKEKTKNRNKTD